MHKACLALASVGVIVALGALVSLQVAVVAVAAAALVLLFYSATTPGSSHTPTVNKCPPKSTSAHELQTHPSGNAKLASYNRAGRVTTGEADERVDKNAGASHDAHKGIIASSPAVDSPNPSPSLLANAGALRLVRTPLRRLIHDLKEQPLDEALAKRVEQQSQQPDWRKFYTSHMPRAIASIAAENTTRDPHIRPVGEAGGCIRPTSEWP